MSEMDTYRAMAKTPDVVAAVKFLGNRIPKVLKNSIGGPVDVNTWVLSGLHNIRVRDPGADPADVAASKTWLTENGWNVPA